MEILSTLASGSTGVVKKAIIQGKSYAVKIILKKNVLDSNQVLKEIKIHSVLNHQNIISYVASSEEENEYRIVMELAEIELFDLIADLDYMHIDLVHFYFRQLLSAVAYLHKIGICHRDIKPENILLDKNGNLKLTDFGQSTCFRMNKKYRIMNTVVGTLKFMAPEVFLNHYDHKIDIWSCGIVLLIMLTGKVAWNIAQSTDRDFQEYIRGRIKRDSPLRTIKKTFLEIFVQLCSINPDERVDAEHFLLEGILSKPNEIEDSQGRCKDIKLLRNYISEKTKIQISFSQPQHSKNIFGKSNFQVSQPLTQDFDITMLKRVYIPSPIDLQTILKHVHRVLEEMLISFEFKRNIYSFNTVDQNNNSLTGEIIIEKLQDCFCLHFSRTKGDCLEFNRLFSIASEKILEMKQA